MGAAEPREQSQLWTLLRSGQISREEFTAGCQWHEIYHRYLACIGAPGYPQETQNMPSDAECEKWTDKFIFCRRVLEREGKRVFHATNAIAVYEEPPEYGDNIYRVDAARVGLAALSRAL